MQLFVRTDANGNLRIDRVCWDQGELQRVLDEPNVNREEVVKCIRQHSRTEFGITWEILGGIETLRRLNLTEWVEQYELMLLGYTHMSEPDERYMMHADGESE